MPPSFSPNFPEKRHADRYPVRIPIHHTPLPDDIFRFSAILSEPSGHPGYSRRNDNRSSAGSLACRNPVPGSGNRLSGMPKANSFYNDLNHIPDRHDRNPEKPPQKTEHVPPPSSIHRVPEACETITGLHISIQTSHLAVFIHAREGISIHRYSTHARKTIGGTFGTGTPRACRHTAGKNDMRHFEKSELILL